MVSILRRWMLAGGVAITFGLSGFCCSKAMRDHHTAVEAFGWIGFVVLFDCLIVVGAYVAEFVQPDRPA